MIIIHRDHRQAVPAPKECIYKIDAIGKTPIIAIEQIKRKMLWMHACEVALICPTHYIYGQQVVAFLLHEFCRREYWSGLPWHSSGFLNAEIKPVYHVYLHWQVLLLAPTGKMLSPASRPKQPVCGNTEFCLYFYDF